MNNRTIFSGETVDFLNMLSERIKDKSKNPEIRGFGFWCRRAHILELKNQYKGSLCRKGIGNVFCAAPSNVPALFAYSMALILLSGCSAAVKPSSRGGKAQRELWDIIEEVLKESPEVNKRVKIILKERGDEEIKRYIDDCDGLMVWGGDKTINEFSALAGNKQKVKLFFPNRFSVCVMDIEAVEKLNNFELKRLSYEFYNDSYGMDQNACSSPQGILWQSTGDENRDSAVIRKWWGAMDRTVKKYEISPHAACYKFKTASNILMQNEGAHLTFGDNNRLRVITLPKASMINESCGCKFGLFVEHIGDLVEQLKEIQSEALQTITCFGVYENEIRSAAEKGNLKGIYRITSVGKATEMSPVWDGKDIIMELSRE